MLCVFIIFISITLSYLPSAPADPFIFLHHLPSLLLSLSPYFDDPLDFLRVAYRILSERLFTGVWAPN